MLRRLNTSKITHELRSTFRNKSTLFAKLLRISNSMIRFIRFTKSRELIGIRHPVKATAVHDCSTDCCTMTIHIFRCRMCYNICSPLDRTAVDRRWKCIVHDQRHSMLMCCLCKLLNIKNRQCRIGNRLTKHRPCIVLECSCKLFFGAIRRYKGRVNSHLLHGYGDQIKSTSVDRGGCHNMASAFADVKQCEEVGCLPGGG